MELDLLIRLIAASVCGGLVGLEREIHGRVAGLRTHILVSLGSCLIMLVSVEVARQCGPGTDASRIAAQVVSGIGFLGAGTILRFKASVRGLTTAASLWVVAGIGLACGIGYYTGAFVTTVLVLSALFFLSKVEKQILRRTWYHDLEIEFLDNDSKHTEKIKKVISKFPTEVKDINIRNTADNHAIFVFSLKLLSDRYKEDLQKALSELPQVVRVSWVEEE